MVAPYLASDYSETSRGCGKDSFVEEAYGFAADAANGHSRGVPHESTSLVDPAWCRARRSGLSLTGSVPGSLTGSITGSGGQSDSTLLPI
jgi:hypothetical protein